MKRFFIGRRVIHRVRDRFRGLLLQTGAWWGTKKKAEKLENRPIRKINCHRRTTVGEGEYSTDLLTARSQSVATGEADLLVKHERRESEERKEYLQLEQPPFDHSDHGWSAGSTGRSSFGRSSRIRGPNGRPPPPTVTTSRVRGRHERHSQGIWLRQTVIIDDDDIPRERYHRTTLSPHTTGARALFYRCGRPSRALRV